MKIFNLFSKVDSFLEKEYEKSMKELKEFFGINWIYNTPSIILIPDRKTIDILKETKTEDWLVGWANGHIVYLLGRKNYEKESCHKYSDEEYSALLKHELCHLFVNIFTEYYKSIPTWLEEGICIHLSGQDKFKKPLKKFEKFLGFTDDVGKGVYNESGFAVELLINKFGKEKFLKLLACDFGRKYENLPSEFKKIYGRDLNYKTFNELLKWQK